MSRILFLGTYDERSHPRVTVLKEGFAAAGEEVVECCAPLGLDTAWRVRIVQRPWLLPVLAARLAVAWMRLWRRARGAGPVDAVVVGYLGHFDVHLARHLFPDRPVILDHLVFASDTALDRGVAATSWRLRLLQRLDRAALEAADIIVVDTAPHRDMVPGNLRDKVVVVRVGAPTRWFRASSPRPPGPLRVVFFGLYTPLQGAPVIGRALRLLAERNVDLQVTMIGRGQDLTATRAAAGDAAVDWLHWVDSDALPAVVAAHDVCLGIFGTGPKARRVVPNKVFQGAAVGCLLVTSDTAVQRCALGDSAVFVPPGDPVALADALERLAADPAETRQRQRASASLADRAFRPEAVIGRLRDKLAQSLGTDEGAMTRKEP